MKRRVAIIGCGWVGSSVAISTLRLGAADELLLNDQRLELAEGEAMDLAQGASFYATAAVRVASIEEMRDADAIVIAARLRRPTRGIAPGPLAGQRGNHQGDRPASRRLPRGHRHGDEPGGRSHPGDAGGIGSAADPCCRHRHDARHGPMRQILARVLRLDPRSVHAQVVGEHGDSEVVLWSGVRASAGPLSGIGRAGRGSRSRRWRRRCGRPPTRSSSVKVRPTTPSDLLPRSCCAACCACGDGFLRWLGFQEGALGIRDVALSMPTIVSAEGAVQIVEPTMSQDERERLMQSAEVLRKAFKQANAS